MLPYFFRPSKYTFLSHQRCPVFSPTRDPDRALVLCSGCPDWLPPSEPGQDCLRSREIREVLSTDDLYHILGLPRSPAIDRLTLRRAYLLRSKACHPDKSPGNPDATHAFQKISIAYRVLSQPSLKQMHDARPTNGHADVFRSYPFGHADETLKGVLLSIVSDYLDGNLEMIRTLLQAVSDLNPSLKLGNDSIDSVISVLEGIRGPVLSCRACILALHSELIRVLELQYAFRQLPYLDITGRSRLTIQLTRITLFLPVTLEKAIQDARENVYAGGRMTTADGRESESDKAALLPRHVVLLIRGIDVILDKMERILG